MMQAPPSPAHVVGRLSGAARPHRLHRAARAGLWAVAQLAPLAVACHPAAEAPMAALPSSVHLETVVAKQQPMPRSLMLSGALIAHQQADIAANVGGRVDKTLVERGSEVAEGAGLVEIDPRSATLNESEARANLASAVAAEQLAAQQSQRNRALFQRGTISKDEWERIENTCRTTAAAAAAARARAGLSRTSLHDATVRAPFAGAVFDRFVSVGEYVQPSTRVVTLVGVSPLRLQLTLAEADLARVFVGQKVSFEVEAYPKERFVGDVRYIDPAVRASTRDIRIDALVDNHDRRLKAGMSATARLEEADAPSLVVPATAIRGTGLEARALVAAGGRLSERSVQVGSERDGLVEVLDGLREGESVVAPLTPEAKDGTVVH